MGAKINRQLIAILRHYWSKFKTLGNIELSNENAFVEHVLKQKVCWQLYKLLCRGNRIPISLILRLKYEKQRILSRNLLYVSEMEKINKIAQKNGIRVIFFKGVALAVDIYGNAGARPCNDIDLLVRSPDDAVRLRRLLKDNYQWIDNLDERQNRHFLKNHCEYMLVNKQNKVLVEIHWKLFHRYMSCEFDLDKVFLNSKQISICGKNFKTLGFADNFIALSVHHAKHQWTELRYIFDLAGFIVNTKEEELFSVLKQAKGMGAMRAVLVACSLTGLIGVKLPGYLINEIEKDRHAKIIANELRNKLLCGGHEKAEYNYEMKLLIHIRERWSDRIRFAIGGLLSPSMNDYKYVDLPESLFFLYYLVRPFRQLIKVLGIF